jgi:hypothetical protein
LVKLSCVVKAGPVFGFGRKLRMRERQEESEAETRYYFMDKFNMLKTQITNSKQLDHTSLIQKCGISLIVKKIYPNSGIVKKTNLRNTFQ